MRGETRRLYREMMDEGYDPTRGLGPLFIAIIVLGIAAPIVALIAVAQAGNVFNDIANALSHFFR